MTQHFTISSTFGQFRSNGYEYLSSIYRMKEEHDQLSSKGITPYVMPVKVLMVACLAIEEYINAVGFKLDPAWKEFDHENEPVKGRIERIYELVEQPVNFEGGIWNDVVKLFDMEKRVKQGSVGFIKLHQEEIPEAIKEAVKKFPIWLSQAIAEGAIELLLTCTSPRIPLKRIPTLV